MEKVRVKRKANKMIVVTGNCPLHFLSGKVARIILTTFLNYLYLFSASATVTSTIDLSAGVISSISKSKWQRLL